MAKKEEYVVVMTLEGRAGLHIIGAVKVKEKDGEDALLTGAELLIETATKDADGMIRDKKESGYILNDVKDTIEKCKGGYEAGSDEFLFISTKLQDGIKEA